MYKSVSRNIKYFTDVVIAVNKKLTQNFGLMMLRLLCTVTVSAVSVLSLTVMGHGWRETRPKVVRDYLQNTGTVVLYT